MTSINSNDLLSGNLHVIDNSLNMWLRVREIMHISGYVKIVCVIHMLIYGSVISKAGTPFIAGLGLRIPHLMGKSTFLME